MDVIALRGLRVYGRHGAGAGERDAEQPFDIEVRLAVDLSAAAHSDVLGDTVIYAAMHERIVGVVESTSFNLLERLAAEVLHEIFRDPRIARAEIEIAKPQLLDGATPSVRLSRENPRYR
jgi:dihydroneopterin aldolase